MTGKNQQMDLCTNCLNNGACCFCRNKKHPVLFCEEFTFKAPGESVNAVERLKRAEAAYLPTAGQGLFDDCGRPGLRGR